MSKIENNNEENIWKVIILDIAVPFLIGCAMAVIHFKLGNIK